MSGNTAAYIYLENIARKSREAIRMTAPRSDLSARNNTGPRAYARTRVMRPNFDVASFIRSTTRARATQPREPGSSFSISVKMMYVPQQVNVQTMFYSSIKRTIMTLRSTSKSVGRWVASGRRASTVIKEWPGQNCCKNYGALSPPAMAAHGGLAVPSALWLRR